MTTPDDATGPLFSDALRFWERGRILYNAVLTLLVLLWIALTWPHFRPAMTLGSLEVMLFLAFLANVCYCAAYLVEFFMQALLPEASWRRFRQTLWVLGMFFALLLANYWIVDEIYPYANQPPAIGRAASTGVNTPRNSNSTCPKMRPAFASCSVRRRAGPTTSSSATKTAGCTRRRTSRCRVEPTS
jgi:hypothetical protein